MRTTLTMTCVCGWRLEARDRDGLDAAEFNRLVLLMEQARFWIHECTNPVNSTQEEK